MNDETNGSQRDLTELRSAIRLLDEEILRKVAERLAIAREIGIAKLARGAPVKDYRVEKEVIGRARRLSAELGIAEDLGETIARTLIDYSCRLQSETHERARNKEGSRRVLVVGGYGGMGRWMAEYLEAFGNDVEIADARPEPGENKGRFPSATLAVAAPLADTVVLATPMTVTPAVLGELGAIARKSGLGALVFDICSLKSPILPALETARRHGVRVGSVHPMFGPSAQSLAGRNIVVCETGAPDVDDEVAAFFHASSAKIVHVPIARHDELMAEVLGLAHMTSLLFAGTLARWGTPYEALESVGGTTFNAQVKVSAGVVRENPDLYYEIQVENPSTRALLTALGDELKAYQTAIHHRDRVTFKSLMESAQSYFNDLSPDFERKS